MAFPYFWNNNTHSLSALETGITVTDMTAEVPSALKTASVLKLDSLLEVDCLTTTDKVKSVQDNVLVLTKRN
ncbi:hypothetical protein LOAG_14333 [Loa loa]|uniref:Uncharacterized protein n=1 Tax=Loa loa TaxID=7209 RepID=A0A1S0TIG0_LOALO|nr:hypothetical protein LOAG_14333 [Loa loa]EFO14190.2 hypothetical protein LOAG_14333 [Loa loa]